MAASGKSTQFDGLSTRRDRTQTQTADRQLKPQIAAKAKERQGTRTDLTENIEETFPQSHRTREVLAEKAKVSDRTIDKVEFLDKNADEKTKEKLRSGDTTINAEFKRLKKEKGQKERELKKQIPSEMPLDDRVRLLNCSVAEAASQVESESIDFIVTDPPYPKEFLSVYDELAEFARHALKPGGSLLCMVGQSYLPEIVQKLSKTLNYHWTLAYLTPGGQATQLWERKVNTFWKPVLWFTKGEYTGDWIGDVTNSKPNDNDKRHHHWGQSESGMFDLMRKFLYQNMTICDPFLGGGTTGIVALSLGCRFIGCDIDQNCIEKSQARFTEWMGDQA